MRETPEDMAELQRLLDESYATAGAHLVSNPHRLSLSADDDEESSAVNRGQVVGAI